MAAPVAQQIISSMRIIMGHDGTDEGSSINLVLYCFIDEDSFREFI